MGRCVLEADEKWGGESKGADEKWGGESVTRLGLALRGRQRLKILISIPSRRRDAETPRRNSR